MARRNIFQPPAPPSPEPAEAAAEPRAPAEPRFPNTGAISGMRSTLRDLSSNAVREIEPGMIEDGGPRDRLAFDDAEIAALAESIRQHGQQVPIMVRTIPDRPGRYRIVYGRRRLRALRLLDLPAKALVRSLSDEQAILAQGQENSQRLDPSFIEKALFAADLAEAGYDAAVILDALAIDKPMLSRMGKVARAIPRPVAEAIGPAHGVGRRRWEELADTARERGIDLLALAEELAEELARSVSDERFARIAQAVARRDVAPAAGRPALPVVHPDGTRLAEIRDAPRALTIRLGAADAPGFTEWMRGNAEGALLRLYEEWKSSADPG
ncbi:MAG: plasmid partitioning protein RepB [Rhodovulum sulfidophilum]|uniref:Plasmid partitioning protein RepB n=1 Tax=Rhodovulum sulfidophilum TaxID=35806 RepID=A0A2W5PYE4_RHOSU|nr:MAG: plasmid partitioning protein RepB [Rhodovulum sulfidophilum]